MKECYTQFRTSLCCLFAILWALFGQLQQTQGAKVWKEQSGIVIIEAESVDTDLNPAKWLLSTEVKEYTGRGYLTWKVWGNMYKDPLVFDALNNPDDLLVYKIWINTPGDYAIHIRNLHFQEDGDNDIWVSINRSEYFKVWDHDIDIFTWSEFESTTWHLQEGINEVAIAGRSKGMSIDRIALHLENMPESFWAAKKIPESPLLFSPGQVDNQPPSPPENIRVIKRKSSSISIAWKAASDNYYVLDYEVFINDRRTVLTSKTNCIVSNLIEGTPYKIYIKARDIAGNLSKPSFTIDTTTVTFEAEKHILAKYVKEPPQIDGKFDTVWHRQIPHPLENLISGNVDSKKDLHGYYRCAWDYYNLYLIVEVHDEGCFQLLKEGVRSWQTDGVRIYIDPDHSQCNSYSIKDRQYRYIGNSDQIREGTQRDRYVQGVFAQHGGPPPGKRSWHEKPDGYFVEMSFPWPTLGTKPSEGKLIGMDVLIQDNDDGTGIQSQIAWAAEGSNTVSCPFSLGTVKLVKELFSGSDKDYLPPQIWQEQNGVVIAEAEDIDYHSNWKLMTEPEGYIGSGYLVWQGPDRSVTNDGRGGNDDYTNERQGPQEEWLIIRVLITNPGLYHVNARNFHLEVDGDNDAWIWRIGRGITDWDPVRRMGDSLNDGTGFTWLDWGVRTFSLNKGINSLYIGGRSIGFGIDRIAIYKKDDPEAKQRALTVSAEPSKLVDLKNQH